jgi:phage-related minor tail protein
MASLAGAAGNTLKLLVETQVKGADKLSGLGAGLQRTGANLTKFVTLPLLGVGAAATAMALEAEKSGAKLTAAFKNMGSKSGKTLEQLEAQADALGEATIFDDEAIKEAQAKLLTFGTVSGEAFDRAIQAAADYAAATGTDVVAATQKFGVALSDPVKGIARLTKAGVVLTDQQKASIIAFEKNGDTLRAQQVLLTALEDRYRNTNEVLQSTDAGKAAQAFEDLANAGEDIGAIFLPVLGQLAQKLSEAARFFTSLDPGMQQFIVTIGLIIAAVGPSIFIIGKLVTAFQGVIMVFNLLKVAMLTNPFTALAVAVVAIAALIILNWDKIWAFLQATWKAITTALSGVVKFFTDAWEGLLKVTTGVWEAISGIIRGSINAVIDVINGFFGFLNGMSFGVGPFDLGPVHIGAATFDPFNIGLIPHLAEGGIIDSPTLALLGESGPEAVVPLTKGGAMGDTHFHSHIDVRGEEPFIHNEDDLVRANRRVAFLAGF